MNHSQKKYYKVRWNCYKLRQPILLQSAMDRYYKLRQLFLITKCDTVYYKLRQTLQSAMNLLQIATGITKCDDYYKLRQYTEWGNPSSETHGQSVGSGERAWRKFSSMGERAPGYRHSPNYFQKFKRMLAPDWAQKMYYYCTQSANSFSWVLFVSSYMTAIASITACLAHAPKECTQSGNFQFDINSPSDFKIPSARKLKTVPKIQVWAYNRYSRLHRSRLA